MDNTKHNQSEGSDETVDQTVQVDAEPVEANKEVTREVKKNPNMRRGRPPKHSPDTLEMAMRRKQAMQYRMMGLSYDQIGEKLNINHQTAWNWIDKELKAINIEEAKEVKKLELGRLDAMFIPIYGNAMRGDLQALNGVMQIMNRRAKLLGIDAPVKTESKTEVSATEGVVVINPVMSVDEWMKAAQAQQAELVRETAPTANDD